MQSIFFFRTSYIIPNMDTVVCGGTAQKDNYNLEASEEDTLKIRGDISSVFPDVKDAPVVIHAVFRFIFIYFFLFSLLNIVFLFLLSVFGKNHKVHFSLCFIICSFSIHISAV